MFVHQIWNSPCSEAQKNYALFVARKIGDRVIQIGEQSLANGMQWNSLENSFLAILCAALDHAFPHQGYSNAAHDALSKSVDLSSQNIALFGGLSQVGAAAHYLQRRYGGYHGLLQNLDSRIAKECISLASQVSLAAKEHNLHFYDYDLTTGLSGVTAYLVSRLSEDSTLKNAIVHSLRTLSYLLQVDADGRRNFEVSPANAVGYIPNTDFAEPVTNLGLAHGIPGILAALSIAILTEIDVDVSHEVRNLGQMLIDCAKYDTSGVAWPHTLQVSNNESNSAFNMIAWCYGSAGVSRALWLAGRALGDQIFMEFSKDALKTAILKRLRRLDQYRWAGVCHGLAGLVLICLRFHHEHPDPDIAEAIQYLVDELLMTYDECHLFGFKNLEVSGALTDDAGFMLGGCGIALTLLAVSCDLEPTWDRVLLLS